MSLSIDTLETSEELREAGFDENQTRALIKTLSSFDKVTVTNEKLDNALSGLKLQLVIWMVGLQIATVSLLVNLLG